MTRQGIIPCLVFLLRQPAWNTGAGSLTPLAKLLILAGAKITPPAKQEEDKDEKKTTRRAAPRIQPSRNTADNPGKGRVAPCLFHFMNAKPEAHK